MRALVWTRKLFRSDRGNVVAIAAAAMPLMIGAAAVGIDTIQLSIWKRQLQRMADAGAIAGARALLQEKSASTAVNRSLSFNNHVPLASAAVVENAPTTGPFRNDTKAVRVVLTSTERLLPFWRFFQGSSPALSVEATARIVSIGPFCMFSTEDGTAVGIDAGGQANIVLGCGMATNSQANPAVTARGEAKVTASSVTAVGGLDPNSRFKSPTTFHAYSEKQDDPLQDLPDPTVPPGPCPAKLVEPPQTETLSPGCFASMTLKGNVTLNPGTYYIDSGALYIASQATVTGTGVTLVLTGNTPGTITIEGGAKLTLSAPTSGDYGGVLIYQDRDAPLLNNVSLAGGSTGKLEGAIYVPRANVTVAGHAGMNTQCLQLVGRRLNFTGAMNITNSCPAGGASKAFGGTFVRLVS